MRLRNILVFLFILFALFTLAPAVDAVAACSGDMPDCKEMKNWCDWDVKLTVKDSSGNPVSNIHGELCEWTYSDNSEQKSLYCLVENDSTYYVDMETNLAIDKKYIDVKGDAGWLPFTDGIFGVRKGEKVCYMHVKESYLSDSCDSYGNDDDLANDANSHGCACVGQYGDESDLKYSEYEGMRRTYVLSGANPVATQSYQVDMWASEQDLRWNGEETPACNDNADWNDNFSYDESPDQELGSNLEVHYSVTVATAHPFTDPNWGSPEVISNSSSTGSISDFDYENFAATNGDDLFVLFGCVTDNSASTCITLNYNDEWTDVQRLFSSYTPEGIAASEDHVFVLARNSNDYLRILPSNGIKGYESTVWSSSFEDYIFTTDYDNGTANISAYDNSVAVVYKADNQAYVTSNTKGDNSEYHSNQSWTSRLDLGSVKYPNVLLHNDRAFLVYIQNGSGLKFRYYDSVPSSKNGWSNGSDYSGTLINGSASNALYSPKVIAAGNDFVYVTAKDSSNRTVVWTFDLVSESFTTSASTPLVVYNNRFNSSAGTSTIVGRYPYLGFTNNNYPITFYESSNIQDDVGSSDLTVTSLPNSDRAASVVMTEDGTIHSFFELVDITNNTKRIQSMSYSPDYSPEVRILSAVDPDTDGVFTVTGESSDENNNIEFVEIRVVDSQENTVLNWVTVTPDSSGDWTYDLDATVIAAGNYNIQVRSFDGNSYSAIISFALVIDNHNPTVSIDDPADQQIIFGDYVFEINISDVDGDLNSIAIIRVNSQDLESVNFTNDGFTGTLNYSWDSRTVSDATYTFKVEVSDLSGEVDTDSVDVVVFNNQLPLVIITNLPTLASLEDFTISGTAMDTDGSIVDVNITIETPSQQFYVQATGTDNWSYTWDSNAMGYDFEGELVTFYVFATDDEGSVGSTQGFVTGNTRPEVTILTPAGGNIVLGTILNITGTVRDDDGFTDISAVRVGVDDGGNPSSWALATLGSNNGVDEYAWSIDYDTSGLCNDCDGNLSPDPHVIAAYAWDSLERSQDASEYDFITINGQLPNIVVNNIVLSSAPIAGSSVNVDVYVKNVGSTDVTSNFDVGLWVLKTEYTDIANFKASAGSALSSLTYDVSSSGNLVAGAGDSILSFSWTPIFDLDPVFYVHAWADSGEVIEEGV